MASWILPPRVTRVGVEPPTVTVTVSTDACPAAVVTTSSPAAVPRRHVTVSEPSLHVRSADVRSTSPIITRPMAAPKP